MLVSVKVKQTETEENMSELRVLCRVVTYNPETKSILLVRNRGQKWWCAPGGGWDYEKETLIECATREVFEEVGVRVDIQKLLFTQTLYIKKQDSSWLENFWLARPTGSVEIPQGHIDHYGVVDEARWFQHSELQAITAYPDVLKNSFWETLEDVQREANRYLGHSIL